MAIAIPAVPTDGSIEMEQVPWKLQRCCPVHNSMTLPPYVTSCKEQHQRTAQVASSDYRGAKCSGPCWRLGEVGGTVTWPELGSTATSRRGRNEPVE